MGMWPDLHDLQDLRHPKAFLKKTPSSSSGTYIVYKNHLSVGSRREYLICTKQDKNIYSYIACCWIAHMLQNIQSIFVLSLCPLNCQTCLQRQGLIIPNITIGKWWSANIFYIKTTMQDMEHLRDFEWLELAISYSLQPQQLPKQFQAWPRVVSTIKWNPFQMKILAVGFRQHNSKVQASI